MSRITVDLFGDILRDVLHACQDPLTFPVNQLLGIKKLNLSNDEITIIKKVTADGNYDALGITLLYTTLRYVCLKRNPPTAGWGRPVNNNDFDLTDDIERLCGYRNPSYGRIAAEVETSEYQILLTEFEVICIRFDTKHVG